jgi:hypothetical protein
MANETTSADVRVVFSVIDKASPAIQEITKSLDGVADVQKNIAASAAAVPRSVEEMVKNAPGNIWGLKVRGEDPAEQIKSQVAAVQAAIAPVKEHIAGVGESLRTFFSELGTGIRDKVGSAFSTVSGLATSLGGTLKTAFTPLLDIAAGAGLGAIAALFSVVTSGMRETVELAGRLGTRADAIGVTVEQLQELEHWMTMGGGKAETLDKGMLKLTRTLGAVKEGARGSKNAAELLDQMGIALDSASTAATILPQIADWMAKTEDPTLRARAAFVLFGGAATDMADQLRKGSPALAEAAAEQQRLGELTTKQKDDALAYAQAQRDFATATEQVRIAIGSQLLPILTPMIKGMGDWVAANREWLATDFAGGIQAVAGFLRSTKDEIDGVVTAWRTVKTAVVDVWTTIKSYTDTPLADIWTPFADAAKAAWTTVAKTVSDAWETIKQTLGGAGARALEGLKGVWDPVVASFSNAWAQIKPILDAMLATLAAIGGSIRKIGGYATTAFDSVTGAVKGAQDAWDRFKGATPPTVVAPPGTGNAAGSLIGAVAGGAAANGQVNVVIENKNAPPGQKTTATASGPGVRTQVDVGKSMPWSAPEYSGPWAPAGA